MKITVEVEVYQDGGGTFKPYITLNSGDIAKAAEEKALTEYDGLSAKAKSILVEPYSEEL